jgi:NifU-like protein
MADGIAESLGAAPAGREHCYLLAVDALRSALADHRRQLIDEYSGEKALICTCFGVSEETIEASIAARGLTEVDEVVQYCRAGGGCGSCLPIIREMLDNAGI